MKKRDINIEFLRIIMIFFIIIHHLVVNGFGFSLIQNLNKGIFNTWYIQLGLVNCIVIIAVNVFFIISGYYHIKFNMNKLLRIYIDVLFYSAIFWLIARLAFNKNIGLSNLYAPLNNYWYIAVYCFLLIICPFLNDFFDYIEFQTFTLFVTVYTFFLCYVFVFNEPYFGVNGGYSIILAVYMYSLGFYLSKYKRIFESIKGKIKKLIFINTLVIALNFALVCMWLFLEKGKIVWAMYRYNNPLIIISSICTFLIFKELKVNSNSSTKWINIISSNVLAIYLIHTNSLIAEYRNHLLLTISKSQYSICNILLMIIYALIILIICSLINLIKQQIFRVLFLEKIIDYISNYINNGIASYKSLISKFKTEQ